MLMWFATVLNVLEELMPVMPDLLVMLLSCYNGKLLIKRANELDSYNSKQCRQVCAFLRYVMIFTVSNLLTYQNIFKKSP